ncbi:VOC family protein [Marinicella rhabdoformis]|uniref:VOC family protein n=1 Tax=Marinicella rhabdoformis TaxID=2580566 RepID=UPI0015D002A4|nr:VOC family protein [Marinicella rhabdoformis]
MSKPQKIGQLAISCSDKDRSVSFYSEVVGLELLFDTDSGMAFMQCGEVRLMLTELQGHTKDHHTSVIYYQLDDLNGWFEQTDLQHVAVEKAPHFVVKMADHDLWMAFLRDPDGHLVGLMEERAFQD